jgi:PEP-CTERM motif
LAQESEFMRTSKLFSIALVLVGFTVLGATQVRADSVNYSYTAGTNTFTWVLPTNPTPGSYAIGLGFALNNISFSETGSGGTTTGTGTMDFFNGANTGGFDLWVGNYNYLINAYGPQLYSGLESAPTMLAGPFAVVVDYSNGTAPPVYGTSGNATSVPEPGTLPLLAIGLAIALAFSVRFFAKISPVHSAH